MIKQIAQRLGLAGLMAAAGCNGCFERPKLEEPKRKDYDNTPGVLALPWSYHGEPELYIWDLDKDGKADGIGIFAKPAWIFPGYEDEVVMNEHTKTMTPEMREAATKALQADRDLGFVMHQEKYRLEQEKENPDGELQND